MYYLHAYDHVKKLYILLQYFTNVCRSFMFFFLNLSSAPLLRKLLDGEGVNSVYNWGEGGDLAKNVAIKVVFGSWNGREFVPL